MSSYSTGRDREWRPIPGLPRYDVSNDGLVRSWVPWKGTELPRILRQYENPDGYLVVRPTEGGRQKTRTVHHLVAVAFLDGPQDVVVRHLNDDKQDNRVENLAWGSRSDNARDAIRNGRHFPANLTHCVKAGHPLAGPNLYVSPSTGKRQCRACNAARRRSRRAA